MQGRLTRTFLRPVILATAMLWLASCGGGGSGNGGNSNTITPTTPTTSPMLAILAGTPGGPGYANGAGSAVRFNNPSATAVDSSGNVYVADSDNHVIRKITPVGVVTTLAGMAGMVGSSDGNGSAARFNYPTSVAVDTLGNVYVADAVNATIRKISPVGEVSTLAGTAEHWGSADGLGAAARFEFPAGIAVDSSDNLYVTDRNNATIRKIDPSGQVSTLAGVARVVGSSNGTGSAARFFSPYGIAVDSSGNLYVADTGNRTIRKISPTGSVTTLAGIVGVNGNTDGPGSSASFNYPFGISVDSNGNVFVTDKLGTAIRKIDSAGVVSTLVGTAGWGSADGSSSYAKFFYPGGISVDTAGNLYVADSGNHSIRKITPTNNVSTLAGLATVLGNTDGSGAAVSFRNPLDVTVDNTGNLYIADYSTIRKITPAGMVSTLAGSMNVGSNDGIGSSARFVSPTGIAVDNAGNVYVTDVTTVRKITPTGVVSTLAGLAGTSGYADGVGNSARFMYPKGIAVDTAGYLYLVDGYNTLRKISPTGIVSTLAGSAGLSGSADGSGSAARFNYPSGITVDNTGNLYVTDSMNATIRKITPMGDVTTLAGTAGLRGSSDGPGNMASFDYPSRIAIDSAGNLYVSEERNHTLRKVTPAGTVTTVAGSTDLAKVETGSLPGGLNKPMGIASFGTHLYVVDNNESVIVSIDLN